MLCLHAGGLTAVMWTDFIQTCIMVVGAIGLMLLGNFYTCTSEVGAYIANASSGRNSKQYVIPYEITEWF